MINNNHPHFNIRSANLIECFCLFGLLFTLSCHSTTDLSKKNNHIKPDNRENEASRLRWEKELERRNKIKEDRLKEQSLAKKRKIKQNELEKIKEQERRNEESRERKRRAQAQKIQAQKEKEQKQKIENARREAQFIKDRIESKLGKLEYSDAFWFVEDSSLKYDTIILEGSGNKKRKRILYKNLNPLQFHSFSKKNLANSYKLKQTTVFSPGVIEITQKMLQRRGHFIILEIDKIDENKSKIKPLLIRLKDKKYYVIDIFSDGEDFLFMDLESEDGQLLFRRILVQDIILQP